MRRPSDFYLMHVTTLQLHQMAMVGCCSRLLESGGLDWFRQQDCRTLVSFQVDNPLAKPLDPEFLGHHLLSGSSLSTQVIPKT